jgi:hypothetical protein
VIVHIEGELGWWHLRPGRLLLWSIAESSRVEGARACYIGSKLRLPSDWQEDCHYDPPCAYEIAKFLRNILPPDCQIAIHYPQRKMDLEPLWLRMLASTLESLQEEDRERVEAEST